MNLYLKVIFAPLESINTIEYILEFMIFDFLIGLLFDNDLEPRAQRRDYPQERRNKSIVHFLQALDLIIEVYFTWIFLPN